MSAVENKNKYFKPKINQTPKTENVSYCSTESTQEILEDYSRKT